MADPLARFADILRRRSRPARLAVAALLVVVPTFGKAVTPLSPQLDESSRLALLTTLSNLGISEVESSAVLVSLLAVLGPEPAARTYRYREPYPHIPDIDAETSMAGPTCVRVNLTAWPKPGLPLVVTGTYCLTKPAAYQWSARPMSLEAR